MQRFHTENLTLPIDLGRAFDWSYREGNLLQPIRSRTQIWRIGGTPSARIPRSTPPGLIYFPIFTTIMTNYVYLKTSAISHKKIFKCSIFSPEPDQ